MLAAAIAAIGCGGPEPARPESYALADLEGQLLYDGPFLVVPNQAWGRLKDEQLWYFASSASIVCLVDSRPAESLVFGLLPRAESDADGLEYLWNGEDVSEFVSRLPSGEVRIAVPNERLTPGTHFLTFRQGGGTVEPRPPEDFRVFRYVGYRLGGKPHVFDTSRFHNYRYVANLASFGVTASFDPEVLGGFAFAGPRNVTLDLGTDRGGLFQTRVLNSGAGRAFFRADLGEASHEVEIGPQERRHWLLEVPRGTRYLDLAVEGDKNGYFLWGAPHFQAAGRRPALPIVLVTLDTTRRDALGVYGADPSPTPNLDALAAESTVFEHAYTTAPWTIPSHASIFTGLYPSKHGAGFASDHLEIGHTTLAEILRNRGYLTAGFAGGLLASSKFGLGQGFATYRDVQSFETKADELTAAVLAFLAEAVVAPEPSPPFFLFVNYFDPHFPYEAPERLAADVEEPAALDEVWAGVFEGSADAWERVVDREVPASAETLEALTAAYRAEVAYVDEQVGKLLDRLREWDLYESALIVVTSDHGELLGEDGYFSHNARLDAPLVEIPLIVKWPGRSEARRDASLVSLVDLFPTVLGVAGGVPEGLEVDGLALTSDAARPGEHAFVLAEEHDTEFHRLPPGMKVAEDLYAALGRDERRTFWEEGGSCRRLGEEGWRPGSCDESRFSEAELRQKLEAHAYRPRVDRIGLSREEHEKLRALGYAR